MKVVITPRGFAKYGLDKYEEMINLGIDVDYNDTGKAYSREELLDKCKDADGMIIGVEKADKELFDKCPNIKIVVKFGVGTDNIDLEYAKQKGIVVQRTVGSNSRSVAETAMSFIIADSKNLYQSIYSTKNGNWEKLTGYEINGKIIGIIGFGAIGQKVAMMANCLGMKPYLYDAFGISQEKADMVNGKICTFDEVIRESDFISVHCPLTEETADIISEKEFKEMKNNAVVINTARGGIINEKDLYEALVNKEIKAAYFDVFTVEPPEKNDKLLALNNFFLTPHIGSRSAEAERNTAVMASDIIIDFFKNVK